MSYISSYRRRNCLVEPIAPCLAWSGLLAAFDYTMYGVRPTPQRAGTIFATLYAYNAMQCPMEAIHGRMSALHNAASAGILGLIGVRSGYIGVPFLPPHILYRLGPQVAGFVVYGGLVGALAVLSGKPL